MPVPESVNDQAKRAASEGNGPGGFATGLPTAYRNPHDSVYVTENNFKKRGRHARFPKDSHLPPFQPAWDFTAARPDPPIDCDLF